MLRRKGKIQDKRGKSRFRKIVDWLHLWLGLVSGIIVVIISITGCLFVFQKEINEMVYHRQIFVTPANTPTLPVSQLRATAQAYVGVDKPISGIVAYAAPDKAWEFTTYKYNQEGLTYFDICEYFETVYVNPYTGAVTGKVDYKHNFFYIVKFIHWSLLLNDKIGQPIVGWSTFIFVILLITGLILWWPKKWTKATREQSFKIRWKASWKRVNYDLHNVLGFYALVIALVLALTGMVWSFSWFQATVYVVASGTTTPPDRSDKTSAVVTTPVDKLQVLDKSFEEARRILPEMKRYGIYAAADPTGVNSIYGYRRSETYYGADVLQFDQYTGKLLQRRNDSHKNAGERLIEMNYDIHVGAIGGIWGKIIAFVVSLICGSLPVTGFYVWWNKKKKAKKKIVLTNHAAALTSL
ncbi:PepSY domain-containing protein [Chitinophaga sp. CB10]|uniref:PepSY-associated TM helix domain-containing protein n=1 Tax=Chitinophaga sp. CB10 TaxID=1891659 RepID=UPI0025C579A8|nr:PepSY-associated TM helix domain-containing protein [Chitinophaga sp. CB10]